MSAKKGQFETTAVVNEINRLQLSMLIAQSRHLDTEGISVPQLAMLFSVSVLAMSPEATPEDVAEKAFIYANAFMDKMKTEIATKA